MLLHVTFTLSIRSESLMFCFSVFTSGQGRIPVSFHEESQTHFCAPPLLSPSLTSRHPPYTMGEKNGTTTEKDLHRKVI